MTEIDQDALKMFGFKVWTYKMGEMVSLMVHLGDQLGLYATMAGSGPMTSDDLAMASDLNERFVREWLLGQAAAGLIDRPVRADGGASRRAGRRGELDRIRGRRISRG